MPDKSNNIATKSENGLLWPDKRAKQRIDSPQDYTGHRDGVISALAGYLSGKTPRVRNRGIKHRAGQGKRLTRRLVRPVSSDRD